MRAPLLAALILLGPSTAWAADEPSGCDKFNWPINTPRAALTAPDRLQLASGADLPALSKAIMLDLQPPAAAALPFPPERAPKDGTFAGFATFKAAPAAGIYTVSLATGAWVDLIQDGHFLKPKAFSGATDCDGIRKTMKYELAAKPFVIQISGTSNRSISVAILPFE